VVAIHQPNFFPWLGYFDKIVRADAFVSLDSVQFPKSGSGTWINRVKLLVAGEGRWITAPVRKGHGLQSILDAEFDDAPWRRKVISTLQASYRKAPYFAETMTLIEPLVANGESKVADYNYHATCAIAAALGIDTGKIVRSSSLAAQGTSNELLIALTRAAGGGTYLCGGGAGGYQQDEVFAEAGVALVHQGFEHPTYPQHGGASAFVAGLSVIDPLMNLGVEGTRALLGRSPGQPPAGS
jgi:hypothetical protein